MNHLCHIFKAEATFFFPQGTGSILYLMCQIINSNFQHKRKKKKGGLCCQVKVVEIVILEMIIGRGLLLLF